MNQNEWYKKLEDWAFDDARLHRLPLAFLPVLAEHLAKHEAVQADNEQRVPFSGDPSELTSPFKSDLE